MHLWYVISIIMFVNIDCYWVNMMSCSNAVTLPRREELVDTGAAASVFLYQVRPMLLLRIQSLSWIARFTSLITGEESCFHSSLNHWLGGNIAQTSATPMRSGSLVHLCLTLSPFSHTRTPVTTWMKYINKKLRIWLGIFEACRAFWLQVSRLLT